MNKLIAVKKKTPKATKSQGSSIRNMAAGEFKAKRLSLIDDVSATGSTVIITKRGSPKAALVPLPVAGHGSLLGRLEGKYSIHGDLLGPVFPLEHYDMLK